MCFSAVQVVLQCTSEYSGWSFFCFLNPFPDSIPHTFLEAGKVGQEFERCPTLQPAGFPCADYKAQYPSTSLIFPSFWGFSLWGLRCFLHPNPCISISARVTEQREAAGIGMSRLLQSVQWVRGDFSVLCTRSPCDRGQHGEPQHWRGAATILPQLAQPGLAPATSEDFGLERQEMLLQGFCGDRGGRWETTNKRPTQIAPG